jgi:N-acetylmuramoyl-L-alanine amidase
MLLLCIPTVATATIDVWIDPGHGGSKPGALGWNDEELPNEAELALDVSEWLEGDLAAFAYVVRKTRNADSTNVSPRQRTTRCSRPTAASLSAST